MSHSQSMASSMSSEENYDEIREIYYKRMNEYFSNAADDRADLQNWGSRLWIKNMISRIKQAEIKTPNVQSHNNLPEIPDTLVVTSKDGKEILAKKIKIDNAEYQSQVVPWEESFDIIQQAHVECNHGDVAGTKLQLAKKEICVNTNCLHNFINLCSKCIQSNQQKIYKKQNKPIYNQAGIFQVVDMTSMPDGQFCYILVYGDMETKLTQFRGLTQNSDMEIAMELFKIFMDLGPPKTLVARKGGRYDNIIKIINKLCHPCKITLEERKDIFDKSSQVKSLIYSWMKESKSTHWEVGCHVVQWKVNNTKSTTSSPYQIVFCSNIGSAEQYRTLAIKTVSQENNAPSNSITESLQTEEDLGILRGEDIKSEIEDSITISSRSSESEIFEDDFAEIYFELESQPIGSENKNEDIMEKSDDLISKEEEINPLDIQVIDDSSPLHDNSLHTSEPMLDIKEKLVESPLEDVIDSQKNVDPLKTFNNEVNLMDCVSNDIQHVNNKNSLLNKDTENTYEVNETIVEDAVRSENAMDNFENLSASSTTLVDIEEKLNNVCIINLYSNKNDKIVGTQTLCNECKMTISTKAYICMTCLKHVHLYCSERVTGVMSAISQVICLSCMGVQTEKGHRELKRKSELCEQFLHEVRKKK